MNLQSIQLIDVLGQLRISTPYAVNSPPMATTDPHPFACKEKLSRSAKVQNTNSKQGKIELHRKLKVVAAQGQKNIPTISFSDCLLKTGRSQKITYIDSFDFGDPPTSYLVSQAQNCEVFIGFFKEKEYTIIRRIIVDSPALQILCFPTSHSDHNLQDNLMLGCKNGKIFMLPNFSTVLESEQDLQLDANNVVDSGRELQSMNMIVTKQSGMYIVLDGARIKRYDFTGNHEADEVKLIKNRMKVIKQTQVGREDSLIIYMEGMHMPCILAGDEVETWFPTKVDELFTKCNGAEAADQFVNLKQKSVTPECEDRIENIEYIEHHQSTNTLVVGCSDAKLYFCLILDVTKETSSQFLSRQWPFRYFIQKRFAVQEGGSINSLTLKKVDPYIVVATDTKVLFYDFQNRLKFSQTIRQRELSPISFVKWTSHQHLLICSLSNQESKVYLYSKLLPIRKKQDKIGETQIL